MAILSDSERALATNLQGKTNFLYYIHNFRGFAILAIVAHHVIISLEWNNENVENAALMLLGNGSVYFVFIAGFLFQFLSAKYEYKSYLKKKFQYVLLPYVLVSLPIILMALGNPSFAPPDWFINQFSEWPIQGQIVMFLFTGALMGQFWFIPMITIYYFISPLLISIDKHPKAYWILPGLIMLTLIIPRPEENNAIQSFIHFASIYVSGMFCSHYRETLLPLIKKKYLLLLSLFAILTLAQYGLQPELATLNSLGKLILSLLIMGFLWVKESQLPQFFNRSMGFVAELSFGIYFVHEYFIILFPGIKKRLGLSFFPHQGDLFGFLLNYSIVLGLSIMTVFLVKQIFQKNSRFIVGC